MTGGLPVSPARTGPSFIDSNIFMYAVGVESQWRAPTQSLLREVAGSQSGKFYTSTEVLQELLHRFVRLGDRGRAFRTFDNVLALGITVLPVEAADVIRARILLEKFPSLGCRDAVHAGVMQGNGIVDVYSYDRDFDVVPWVSRHEPS